MKKNQIKEKLAAGKPVYGAMVQFPDADLVEMLGYAGFDWILIDAEHGSINENDCLAMVRACELANATAIVRPPTNHAETIMRFLDCGAQGIQVPRVNTAAEARAAVDAVMLAVMTELRSVCTAKISLPACAETTSNQAIRKLVWVRHASLRRARNM